MSNEGEALAQQSFDDRMRDWAWRTNDDERVAANAVQIRPGLKEFWSYALRYRFTEIEACLNELQVP